MPPPMRVRTHWGSPTLVQAARNLLSYALADDKGNGFFALLSDSCVPLYPLRAVAAFLHDTGVSWMVHTPGRRKDLALDVFAATKDIGILLLIPAPLRLPFSSSPSPKIPYIAEFFERPFFLNSTTSSSLLSSMGQFNFC